LISVIDSGLILQLWACNWNRYWSVEDWLF